MRPQMDMHSQQFLQVLNQHASLSLGYYQGTCSHCFSVERVTLTIFKQGRKFFIQGDCVCPHCGARHKKVEEVGLEAAYLAYIGATKGVA